MDSEKEASKDMKMRYIKRRDQLLDQIPIRYYTPLQQIGGALEHMQATQRYKVETSSFMILLLSAKVIESTSASRKIS